MDSILTSIKKLLGIDADYRHFDQDIIMHINSAFAMLTQLGVGPENGFSISDESAVWDDFIPDSPQLGFVKSFMYLKVRIMFDPPLTSSVLDSMQRQIDEFVWRIQVAADPVE